MRKCMISGRLYYFHKWVNHVTYHGVSKAKNADGVPVVSGIVEDVRTGEIRVIDPERIKFVDIPDGEFFRTTKDIDKLEQDLNDGVIRKIHSEEQCSTNEKKCFICDIDVAGTIVINNQPCCYHCYDNIVTYANQLGKCANCNCAIPKDTLTRNQNGDMICGDCHEEIIVYMGEK